jgi:hypothetical protein
MRSINVDTDVYAEIWSRRLAGEHDEDAILARVLGVARSEPSPPPAQAATPIGFSDPRFDINLPEGFEIFRTYKGQGYRAKATGGRLHLLGSSQDFPSLNQLSRAVSGNVENAWRNWYFTGKDGKRHLVEGLRNDITPSKRHLL